MANKFWEQWLNEVPEVAWGTYRPQIGSQNFLDYWRNQYSNVYGSYQGKLGQMGLAGQTPNLDFTTFLGGYPFLEEWLKKSPWARGEKSPASLRWNIPW